MGCGATKKISNGFKLHIACVAEAVAFIHERRVTHRDIKPPNLLLDAQGHCKLADFGAAKIGGGQTRACVGTPQYRALEMVRGACYDAAVDWWALGCVLFELWSGKPLFTGKTDNFFSVPLRASIRLVQQAFRDATA